MCGEPRTSLNGLPGGPQLVLYVIQLFREEREVG